MLSFEQASEAILDGALSPPASEAVALADADGRVAASDLRAPIDVPGYDNSAMDGYAVRCDEVQLDRALPVSQRIPAGAVASALQPGTVARIFTGAMIPAGADAVILQEDTQASDGSVRFTELPRSGQHIRPAGQDLQRGQAVLAAGERLDAARLGLLASVGIDVVDCYRPLRVAFFSSGDELAEPGQPLQPGQIYNSNRFVLGAALRAIGIDAIDLGRCEDSAEATRTLLLEACGQCDCLITTGGMSVGEEDHVRTQLEALGQVAFWKIAMKPGKPVAFGQISHAGSDMAFFGLPGNPVSAFVTFGLLVRPWLLKSMGAAHYLPRRSGAIADFDFDNRGPRKNFLRATVHSDDRGQLHATIDAQQSSGVLSSMVRANALVPVAGNSTIARGDYCELVWLD